MGLNLKMEGFNLLLAGMPGMSSYNAVSIVHSMFNCFGLPYAVLQHWSGNDIGQVPCGKLLYDIKFMLFVIIQMLPGCKLIFSSILPRLSWRFSDDFNATDKTRKLVNRGIKS